MNKEKKKIAEIILSLLILSLELPYNIYHIQTSLVDISVYGLYPPLEVMGGT